MKRPTWATVVGVIGIIIGTLGILGGAQTVMMPKMIDMQKALWADMKTTMAENDITEPQDMPAEEIFQMMEKMWDVPGWFDVFCVIAGLLGVLVSGFYVFSCIRILQVRPAAIGLFYAAAGVSIGFTLVKGVFVMAAMSFMGMSLIVGGLLGVVINTVMMIVAATADKTAIAPPAE